MIEHLSEAGLTLPPPLAAKGSYVSALAHGDLLLVSGHTDRTTAHGPTAGVVGENINVKAARASARLAALNCLSAAAAVVGLQHLAGVLRIRGYIRAVSSFQEHSYVIDGASELLVQLFPTSQGHVRTAIGVSSLPGGAAVELDALFSLAAPMSSHHASARDLDGPP